ncbi:hypothetical protein [Nocardioides massiliensis]|uniref:Uncharacterized protein n=1 Tax=Nocardioides massiliensis TaxID=1325935 RepID=A0ABT9NJ07_9ACTN|nr:hypothetical protein [Nocardioides massiliensis]MDP9820401.1 hypothetical protein [Nocardioides massiliensis]
MSENHDMSDDSTPPPRPKYEPLPDPVVPDVRPAARGGSTSTPPTCTGRDDCTADTHIVCCPSELRRFEALLAERDAVARSLRELVHRPAFPHHGPSPDATTLTEVQQQLTAVREMLRNEMRSRHRDRYDAHDRLAWETTRINRLQRWCRSLTIATVCMLVTQAVLIVAVAVVA